MNENTAPILDTVQTGATKLGISEPALRMLIHRQGLPVTKLGGRIYLEMPIVREWLAQHRVTSTKAPGVAGKLRKIY